METSPDRTRRSGGHARSGPLLRARDVSAGPPLHRAPVAASRQGTRARPGRIARGPLVAGAAGVVVLLVGGTALLLDGDDGRASATAAGPRTSSPVPTPSVAPPPAAPSAAVVAATAAARTPADARAALEELLAVRAEGQLTLLRTTLEGDAAAAAQAVQTVAGSSEGLSAVLTSWRGVDLATRVRAGLDGQSEASRAYAAAVAADDTAAADQARGRMGEVSRELGGVLAGVTGGRIADYVPPQDAAQYRAYVDALEAEDAAAAEGAAEWLRGRLPREGVALAAGLSEAGPS